MVLVERIIGTYKNITTVTITYQTFKENVEDMHQNFHYQTMSLITQQCCNSLECVI
jgi:hypothetical protein